MIFGTDGSFLSQMLQMTVLALNNSCAMFLIDFFLFFFNFRMAFLPYSSNHINQFEGHLVPGHKNSAKNQLSYSNTFFI